MLQDLNAALAEIPLTQAMGLQAAQAGAEVVLAAGLAPNSNHKGTAFGGSLHSAAILAGWAWLWAYLRQSGQAGQIVIQKAQAEFILPVEAGFTAHCQGASAKDLERLRAMLSRKGRGRVALACTVESAGKVCMRFEGEYVVVAKPA